MRRLERYTIKGGRPLRLGYTTGTCAAAAAAAAAQVLLGADSPSVVQVNTPGGITVELDVEELMWREHRVVCAVRKDAGDDPDITDGILVYASVEQIPSGIEVDGGAGVGRITREGLRRPVGEAAINPVPLAMIRHSLEEAMRHSSYTGGLKAVISVPDGEALAKKTYNPRLGIQGGISILGTTGIVEPMSQEALVSTIRAEMDMQRAQGKQTLLLSPGNYGREFARDAWGIRLEDGVKCSNFVGEALDYAAYCGFSRILLVGHAGKLVKLAGGIMNTHSAVADARMDLLACHCALQGVEREKTQRIFYCVTVDEADLLLREWGMAHTVWSSVADRIAYHLEQRLAGRAKIAFAAFSQGGIVLESPNVYIMVDEMRKEAEH